MRISAKVDYAVRAGIELAAAEEGKALKGDLIAERQDIPVKFLENILGELKHHGIIASRRGAEGGYWLAKDAADVSIADVIRAVEGPLASVRGEAPENLGYEGSAAPLQKVWIAVRANLRAVLEETTLEDLVGDGLPAVVLGLTEPAEAWEPR
jgi:Rrf2 family protein